MFCFMSHTVEQQTNLQQEVAHEPDLVAHRLASNAG